MNPIQTHFPNRKSFTRLDELGFEMHEHLIPQETYRLSVPSMKSGFDLDDDRDIRIDRAMRDFLQ